MDANDDLPEIAIEDMDAPPPEAPPVEVAAEPAALTNPLDDIVAAAPADWPPAEPPAAEPEAAAAPPVAAELAAEPLALAEAPQLAAEPVAAEPPQSTTRSDTVSVDDLKGDILGGVDFDLPIPPAAGATATAGIAARAIVSTAPAPRSEPAKAAPSSGFGGFKPATPAFAAGGVPKPFGSAAVAAPAPSPVAARPAEAMVDPKSLLGEASDAKTSPEALRALLSGDTPVAQVPPEALRLAFQLCRVLIKKGVIAVDDLLQ